MPTFHIAKLGYYKNTTNIEFLHHFLKKGYVNISGGWREEESPISKYKAVLARMKSWQLSHNMRRRPADTASSCTMPSPFPPYQLCTSHSSDWKSVPWDTGRALHSTLTTRGRASLTTLCNTLLSRPHPNTPSLPHFISLHSYLPPFPYFALFLPQVAVRTWLVIICLIIIYLLHVNIKVHEVTGLVLIPL